MELIFRTIGYVIILAINIVLYWFLHSQFHYIVITIMLSAPLVSILLGYILKRSVSVDVNCRSDGYGEQNGETYFAIKIKNPTWLVSLDAKVIINIQNSFFETTGRQIISVPIHARKGYVLELPVITTYPGIIKIEVDAVKIKDLMGFYYFNKKCEASAELTVMPENIGNISFDNSNLDRGMLESEESSKRGNDFSDVQEIREYIPGDKLMSIHWKLSAKRDILMVKDRVSMSDRQLVIVPELYGKDPAALNIILAATYTAILQLIENKTTVRLVYWSANRYEYEDVRIDYSQDAKDAFAKMFYERTYDCMDEAASHMSSVHPEMKAFVHVTCEGGEAKLNVRENG